MNKNILKYDNQLKELYSLNHISESVKEKIKEHRKILLDNLKTFKLFEKVWVASSPDGSVGFEWNYDDRKLCITYDSQSNIEFYATNPGYENFGYILNNENFNNIINWLLTWDIQSMNKLTNSLGSNRKRGHIDVSSIVDDSSFVDKDSKVFDNAQILSGAQVYLGSTIKDNAIIQHNAWIRHSIISDNVIISGNDCCIENSCISGDVKISNRIRICNLELSGNIRLHSNKKIWIHDKEQLKKFVKKQDKTNNKSLIQIMSEELSLFECSEM